MPVLVSAETDERAALLQFVEAQRGALRRAVGGLTEEQASSRPTVSELSVVGVLKHCAEMESNWVRVILAGRPSLQQRDQSNWADSFRLVDGEGRGLAIGRLYDPSGDNELTPLDDFGRRDLGALNIEFRTEGDWQAA